RRLPHERAGLAGGVRVVHPGPVGFGVTRAGVVYQHRRGGRGPGVHVERGARGDPREVLVEDGPAGPVVEHPDRVVVVDLVRAVVRGHQDPRVGIAVEVRVVQIGVVVQDVRAGGHVPEAGFFHRSGRRGRDRRAAGPRATRYRTGRLAARAGARGR